MVYGYTGRWADGVHLNRTDRLCLVCKSLDCVEDEQHFLFDCSTNKRYVLTMQA